MTAPRLLRLLSICLLSLVVIVNCANALDTEVLTTSESLETNEQVERAPIVELETLYSSQEKITEEATGLATLLKNSVTTDRSAEEEEALQNTLSHLRATQAIISQRIVLTKRYQQLTEQAETNEKEKGTNESAPEATLAPVITEIPSFLELEQLKEQRFEKQGLLAEIQTRMGELTASATMADENKSTAEATLRRLLDNKQKPEGDQARVVEAERAETRALIQETTALAALKSLEHYLTSLEQESLTAEITEIEQRIRLAGATVIPTEDEQATILKRLDEQEEQLTKALENTEGEFARLQSSYGAFVFDNNDEPTAEEKNRKETITVILDATQKRLNALQRMLSTLVVCRTTWERRFSLLTGSFSRDSLSTWQKWSRKKKGDAMMEERQLNAELTRLQAALIDLEVPRRLKREYENTRNQTLEVMKDAQKELSSLLLLLDSFSKEIQEVAPSFDWDYWAKSSSAFVASLWNYELFVTVDNRPITVGKLLLGLFLLLGGYVLSRKISCLFVRRVVSRLALTEAATAAIQTVTFYLLFLSSTLFALQLVNVPLTIFTYLGGALAIGIGFGSQNLVNNFISGLILLTERPIKVGDLLEIEGIHGRVRSIGARSTVIRTSSNIDLIVPNSSFLEKSVVNWTRDDLIARLQVDVGVAYGSPTREVERLLHKALSENRRVIRKTDSLVLFLDFADSALHFRLLFWAHIRSLTDKQVVESEVRYAVDELFRAHGISIAFPQLDVHLDTTRALEFQRIPTGTLPKVANDA